MDFNGFILLVILLYQLMKFAISERCREDEFQCLDGECISLKYRNDMIADCQDRSDLNVSIGCLRRHDIYGNDFTSPFGRRITKDGKTCSSVCDRYEGHGIMCDVNERKEYCHVPFCGLLTADDRVACDFTTSFCGWQIRSNTTVTKWISEGKATIKITGENITRTFLVSPINDNVNRYELTYSVNKSRNCLWRISESVDRSPSWHWRKDNCTECSFQSNPVSKMSFALWVTGNGYFELILEFSVRTIDLMYDSCDWNRVNCDNFCRDLTIFQDGFNDCSYGDEGPLNVVCMDLTIEDFSGTVGNDCSRNEVKCTGSGMCLPKAYPLSLQKQCLSGQKSFPYQPTETKCPSFYICKQYKQMQSGLFPNNGTICLSQKEICDGIPQCPFWDDEASCSKVNCPPGCTSCSNNMYRCSSSVILDIPSTAVGIDVSGQNVQLRDVCFIRRYRLLSLNLSHCNLSEIRCVTFRFLNLRYLDVSYNNLETPFIRPILGLNLILDGNPIKSLSFRCHGAIRHLSLKGARVQSVYSLRGSTYHLHMLFRKDSSRFETKWTFHYMYSVDFSENEIESISFLYKFSSLRYVNISKNKVSYLNSNLALNGVIRFIAHDNLLSKLSNLSFTSMPNLEVLDLSGNRIESIVSNIFRKNLKIREIYLQKNNLKSLPKSLLVNLNYLEILRLDDNHIVHLPTDFFYDQVALMELNLRNNDIKVIPNRLFRNLVSLRSLDLSGNDIHVYEEIFYGLVIDTLKVETFAMCCAKPRSVSARNCHAPIISLSSCRFLLKVWPLGVCFWYLSILLLAGNLFKIYRHLKDNDMPNKWNKTFRMQMSIADIMMGFFLFSIGLKDVASKGKYGFVHDEWIRSWQCDALQLISSSSLEATLILSVIASILKLNPTFDIKIFKINIVWIVAWIMSIAFATGYFFWNKLTSQMVSLSPQICMALPIIYHVRDSQVGGGKHTTWIFVWLIIHASCSLIILSAEIVCITRLRSFQRRRDIQLLLTITSVAVRDLSICITGFIQMEVIIPDIFHEVILFIIPTCSIIGTFARLRLKSPDEIYFDIKEIILRRMSSGKLSGKVDTWKTIIVLDPLLKSRIKRRLNYNDIIIVLSDQTGWKQTIRKIKILRHMIICETSIPNPNVHIDVTELIAQILNKTSNTCIGQGSLKCEQRMVTTTA